MTFAAAPEAASFSNHISGAAHWESLCALHPGVGRPVDSSFNEEPRAVARFTENACDHFEFQQSHEQRPAKKSAHSEKIRGRSSYFCRTITMKGTGPQMGRLERSRWRFDFPRQLSASTPFFIGERQACGRIVNEWAVQAFERYPNHPTMLKSGMRLGLEVAVLDTDPRPSKSAFLTWARPPTFSRAAMREVSGS
jgi:hypothetical protein